MTLHARSQRRNTTVHNGAELYRAHAEICHSVDVRVPLRNSIAVSSIHEQRQCKPKGEVDLAMEKVDITKTLPTHYQNKGKALSYIRSISKKQIDITRVEDSLARRDSFRMERY
jgi:hypothetical protein